MNLNFAYSTTTASLGRKRYVGNGEASLQPLPSIISRSNVFLLAESPTTNPQPNCSADPKTQAPAFSADCCFTVDQKIFTVIRLFCQIRFNVCPIPSRPIQHSPHACPIPTKPEKPPKPENRTNSQAKHGTRKHQRSPSPQRNKNTHKPLPQHYPTAATSTNKQTNPVGCC